MLAIVEIVYVVGANYVLRTGWLTDRINREPDKLYVNWESAWTVLPALVHVDSLTVRNRTGNLFWQAQVDSVNTWVALFPLARQTFRTHWVDADGLTLWMRPLGADDEKDDTDNSHFPPLELAEDLDREPSPEPSLEPDKQDLPPTASSASKQLPGWTFAIEGLNISAMRDLWVAQYRLTGNIAVETDLIVQVNGPITMQDTQLRMSEASVTVAGEVLAQDLRIVADVDMEPFDPKASDGPFPTRLISGRVQIEASQSDYRFVNYYLDQYEWPRIVGAGNVSADLRIKQGRLLEDSWLKLSPVLNVEILDYEVAGIGDLHAQIIDDGERGNFDLVLADVEFYRRGQRAPHLRSPRLAINATTGPIFLGIDAPTYRMALDLARADVPDVRVFNTYLASDARFKLLSGQGTLGMKLALEGNRAEGDIQLSGNGISVETLNRPITGDVSITIPVRDTDLSARRFDVSGTQIVVKDALPKKERRGTHKPWSAEIKLTEAWVQALDNERALGYAFRFPDGIVKLDGDVSDIRFLNRLIPSAHSVEFRGPARLQADADIEAGKLAPGTRLDIRSDRLATKFLDFVVSGKTDMRAQIDGEFKAPSGSLRAKLTDIRVRRVSDTKPFVRGAEFELFTHARRFDFDKGLSGLNTKIKLGPAEIPDMTIYNQYFPNASDAAILSGRGDIDAAFELYGTRARGQVNVSAQDIVAQVQEHKIETDLRVKTKLNDGHIKNMQFDLAGTAILLDKVDLLTENDVRDENWWGQVYIEKGDLLWKRPLQLDSQIRIKLRDTGPIVHLFVKKTRTNETVNNILTVRDITGRAGLRVTGKDIELSNLHLTGEKLLMLGQLQIKDKKPTGALYAKYKIVGVGVELNEGKHKLRLANARSWYDRYTGQVSADEVDEPEDFGD